MPSKAKMTMNKKSRNNSEMIERILLSSEMTRFLREDQYLKQNNAITADGGTNEEVEWSPVVGPAPC